jgi:hypothetical protein
MTKVIVSGAVANKHRHGGSLWVRLSWAEGLRQLGFDVVFVDELQPGGSADVFASVLHDLGIAGALIDGAAVTGMAEGELHDHLDDAALLVNLSGHLRRPELLRRVRRRVFVDLDPGYTQIWRAQGHDVGLEHHHLYFTVGQNVGTRRSSIPAVGIRWRPILQPVVLERWPLADGPFTSFTTVASWRGAFGPVAFGGRSYGVKAHEFRRFAGTPDACGLPFAVALDLDPADHRDREALQRANWRLVDPQLVATPDGFAQFVRSSGAEFSVAQGVYVDTASGWFSDRTVRYLASGRPAVVQDTGIRDAVPVGEGLLTFRTPAEAAARAIEVVDDYDRHRHAARRIAEEFFAADRALAPLLEAAGVAP